MSEEWKLSQARLALAEVMEWIRNWQPDFIYDDEWQSTADKVANVLTANPTKE